MSVGEWRIAAASVAGTSHLMAGSSCQDYYVAQVILGKNGVPALVAAVSDGAGSAARGGSGAKVVCERWLHQMTRYVAHSLGLRSDDGLGWALDARAALNALAVMDQLPLSDYACTFLGVCVLPEEALVVQVGDGAIVLGTETGFEAAFWPEQGEYANATAFLSDDDPDQRARSWVYSRPVREVALFSDGLQRLALNYESREAFTPFFESMFSHLRGSSADRRAEMSEALATFLGSDAVNERTDDDKTLVLATHRTGGSLGAR